MIIYGSKGTHLKTERVNNIRCDYCQQQTPHNISVFGRYAYLYWIPFFPMGKKAISECTHCKVTLEKNNMNQQLQTAHDTVKGKTKTPFWYWAGLIILATFIVPSIFSYSQHKKDVQKYIAQPKTNDIIEYKSSASNYSTLKITNVTADSVYIIANSMEISKRSKLYKIDKESNYNAERFALSLPEYKEAFSSKRFLDVDR